VKTLLAQPNETKKKYMSIRTTRSHLSGYNSNEKKQSASKHQGLDLFLEGGLLTNITSLIHDLILHVLNDGTHGRQSEFIGNRC